MVAMGRHRHTAARRMEANRERSLGINIMTGVCATKNPSLWQHAPAKAEGDVCGDGGHDDLVVRVLEHKTHRRVHLHMTRLHAMSRSPITAIQCHATVRFAFSARGHGAEGRAQAMRMRRHESLQHWPALAVCRALGKTQHVCAHLRLQEAAYHAQERALAAAVGAQQHVQGAPRDLQVCSGENLDTGRRSSCTTGIGCNPHQTWSVRQPPSSCSTARHRQ